MTGRLDIQLDDLYVSKLLDLAERYRVNPATLARTLPSQPLDTDPAPVSIAAVFQN
jgi:hypothetical protein